MEDKVEISKQRLKQLENILKAIKKNSGYNLEDFSDLNDFLFDLKILEFDKKKNKEKVEKKQKLLQEIEINDEENKEEVKEERPINHPNNFKNNNNYKQN